MASDDLVLDVSMLSPADRVKVRESVEASIAEAAAESARRYRCRSWCDGEHGGRPGPGVLHVHFLDGIPLGEVEDSRGCVARSEGELHVRVTLFDSDDPEDVEPALIDLALTGATEGLLPREARRLAGWLSQAADIAEGVAQPR